MSNATAEKSPAVVLTFEMSSSECFDLMEAGKVSKEAYREHMADRDKRSASKPKKAGKKTECPISRTQFLNNAPALDLSDMPVAINAREFSTGSFGYFGNGKVPMKIDGQNVTLQVNIQATVIGSKTAPK